MGFLCGGLSNQATTENLVTVLLIWKEVYPEKPDSDSQIVGNSTALYILLISSLLQEYVPCVNFLDFGNTNTREAYRLWFRHSLILNMHKDPGMGPPLKTQFSFGYTVQLGLYCLNVWESSSNAGICDIFEIVQQLGKPSEKEKNSKFIRMGPNATGSRKVIVSFVACEYLQGKASL